MKPNFRVISAYMALLCIIVLANCTPSPSVWLSPRPLPTIFSTPAPNFSAATASPQQPISSRIAYWQDTLDVLTKAMARFAGASPDSERLASITNAVTTLESHLPHYNDQEIVIAIMQAVAQSGIPQTTLNWQSFPGFDRVYPFQLTWFDNGLYVTKTTPAYQELLGMRLAYIDRTDISTAQQLVQPLISYNDAYAIYAHTPTYLVNPGVLYGLHILSELEEGTFIFKDSSEHSHLIHLTPVSPNAITWESVSRDATSSGILPIASNYWFEYWNENETLYLQYNRCESLEGLPFEAVIEDLFTTTSKYPVSRLIVDLRHNTGGDKNLIQPLIHHLWEHPDLNQIGKVFVIIGQKTLSAGLETAELLWEQTAAIVVSEPMPPIMGWSSTAEVVNLPHWNLTLWHTNEQSNHTFQPDHYILPSAHAFLNGQDPILYVLDQNPDSVATRKLPSVTVDQDIPAQREALSRSDKWQQDLSILTEVISTLPEIHPGAFITVSNGTFARAANELAESIPILEDHKIVVGIMSLLTKLGDAHTRVSHWDWDTFQTTSYPIQIQRFSDGVYVIATQPNYEDLIGLQLTHIGGKEIAEVTNTLRNIVPHENEYGLQEYSVTYMMRPVILHALGFTPDLSSANFIFIDTAGETTIRNLPAIDSTSSQTDWAYAMKTHEFPRYLQQPRGVYYWYTYLENDHVLYFQYNVCAEIEHQPFQVFIDEMFVVARKYPDTRLVIDLRRNEGGFSQYIVPFFVTLRKHPEYNQEGKLFVLISGRTFSTAVYMTSLLKEQTRAILVGEPTAQGANFHASFLSFDLPHSGLVIHYPTMYWKTSEDTASTIKPDIEVQLSSTDYFAGNDPVLKAALSYRP